MRIIVTGAQGQLGQEVIRQFQLQHKIYGYNSKDLDVTDIVSVYECMNSIKPDIIVNCAAYNSVDDAESNPHVAKNVNVIGPKNIAEVSQHLDAVMVHFSSDFVFDGEAKVPYRENDPTRPINIYGQTKLDGEQHVKYLCEKHIIIRTAWLYGSPRKNFFNSIIEQARKQKTISVVEDQVGNPTYLPDLVMQLVRIIDQEVYGLYHCSGNGYSSKYEFAKRILSLMKLKAEAIPVRTNDYPIKARRPKFSALSNSLLESCVSHKMPYWEDSLFDYVNKINC
ncbi:dTDP-4-dehydrorhamnose reductase [Paenibacillus sp. NPDC058910]|uniref:dTDP-4-dehydrorhamnose reductase n=1 Tax=unclassified Paenibacillus TaxID=185978 RepID=UPI0036B63F45